MKEPKTPARKSLPKRRTQSERSETTQRKIIASAIRLLQKSDSKRPICKTSRAAQRSRLAQCSTSLETELRSWSMLSTRS